MAQEPSNDSMTFSPRPQPGLLDPSNLSAVSPEITERSYSRWPAVGYIYSVPFVDVTLYVGLLLGLFGMVGNGTVIGLLGFRVKRNPFSVYILNLAIADFTFLLCQSIVVIMILFHYIPYKPIVALISLFLMLSMAGLSLLMAISTERCLSVTFPIWYKCHRPAHLSTTVCALIWGLSLCLGIPWFLCVYYDRKICYTQYRVYSTLSLLTLLVLCVSSLTLLIRVQCCSRLRQVTKLYRVILLTVLAFLGLGMPLSVSFLVRDGSYTPYNTDLLQIVFYLLAALNSAVNPVIYFFVGRQGQRPGRRALRELLQSALTEDTS